MTTDIRDLLHGATPEPQRRPDVAALIETAQRRQRRRRGIAISALVAVIVAAGSGGLLVFDRQHGNQRIDAAGNAATNASKDGVGLQLPAGWQQLPAVVATDPHEVLVVGTAARPTAGLIVACTAAPPVPTGASVYVSIFEYAPGAADAQTLPGPGQQATYGRGNFQPRPNPLTETPSGVWYGADCPAPTSTPTTSPPVTSPPTSATTPPTTAVSSSPTSVATGSSTGVAAEPSTTVPTTTSPALPNHFREITFIEAGRLFDARVVSFDDPSKALLTQGVGVLNTLHVDGTPPVSSPPTTISPPTTGPPPNNPATARQAIADAYLSAFGGGGPVQHQDAVEGGDPLNPTTAQLAGAANAPLVGPIRPRINSLVFVDNMHASLNFDLLINGQPITANTDGGAVLESGHWKITRATYCEVVRRNGNVQCPG